MIEARTHPSRYRHWRLTINPPVARLTLDVDERGGLGDYLLKLNSYDLSVDIELADAVQRLRFGHPEVGAVLIESARPRVFSAGANIGMLTAASHPLKVNFCKFTNETRLAIEDASANSGQRYVAAVNGTAAGGGFELALACDEIVLIDDGSAAVALPEVPLLGVLPATGGLTRLTDKRLVRRDRADILCTTEEGIKGRRALEWGLVDVLVPGSRFAEVVNERLAAVAASTDRPSGVTGLDLGELERIIDGNVVEYSAVRVEIDRELATAMITIEGPAEAPPEAVSGLAALGTRFWPLRWARELDDALLHLRLNEPEVGTIVLRSVGDPALVAAHDSLLSDRGDDWLVREVQLLLKRTLKRLDMTARSLVALVEPGSCFSGSLAELVLAADRSYMLDGDHPDHPGLRAQLSLTSMNFGPLTMGNGLTRLATRFLGHHDQLAAAEKQVNEMLVATAADELGLVTAALDHIDWDDEIRIFLEERAGFSPDSLTGMEANLRAGGPETMETKIFGRLTAWQNWVFQRPNASGPDGTLARYGTGRRPQLDRRRT